MPVVVVGGGPAGAVLALTLARRGLPPVVLEARAAPESKVGECLPPSAKPLLVRLGLAERLAAGGHLPSYGNRSVWGSDQPADRDFLFGLHGAGWHLDRRRFEEMLAGAAREAGVDWRAGARLLDCTWRHGRWDLLVEAAGGRLTLEADFVVDASGRRSRLARRLGARRVRYDRLVGVAALLATEGRGGDTFTLVEAVSGGWWYSALLADGRLAVAFLTDGDLLEPALRRPSGWWERLRATGPTWKRLAVAGARPADRLRLLPAESSRLTALVGEGGDGAVRWLAVGDAAAAYDPLSSHGIGTALGSGFYAAHAVADTLAGNPDAPLAYLSLLEEAYGAYLDLQREHYALERRWPAAEFWRRRHAAGYGRVEV